MTTEPQINSRCAALTLSGDRCRSFPVALSQFCGAHDPISQKHAARSRARRRLPRLRARRAYLIERIAQMQQALADVEHEIATTDSQ